MPRKKKQGPPEGPFPGKKVFLVEFLPESRSGGAMIPARVIDPPRVVAAWSDAEKRIDLSSVRGLAGSVAVAINRSAPSEAALGEYLARLRGGVPRGGPWATADSLDPGARPGWAAGVRFDWVVFDFRGVVGSPGGGEGMLLENGRPATPAEAASLDEWMPNYRKACW